MNLKSILPAIIFFFFVFQVIGVQCFLTEESQIGLQAFANNLCIVRVEINE